MKETSLSYNTLRYAYKTGRILNAEDLNVKCRQDIREIYEALIRFRDEQQNAIEIEQVCQIVDNVNCLLGYVENSLDYRDYRKRMGWLGRGKEYVLDWLERFVDMFSPYSWRCDYRR